MHAPTRDKPQRVIVDPAVWEAEQAFQKMMARFRAMTPEEHLRWDVEHGFRRPDGSWILPEGDPCVTRVDVDRPPSYAERRFDEGVRTGREDALVLQLRAKFGALDEDTLDRIRKADDAQLDQWLTRILDAKTRDAIF